MNTTIKRRINKDNNILKIMSVGTKDKKSIEKQELQDVSLGSNYTLHKK